MFRKSGHCTWPPLWTTTKFAYDDKPKGEVGTLEDVLVSNFIENKIFLFMFYRGYRYMGVMGFDDPDFSQSLFEILKLRRGFSIKEIGDLDLSHTL